MPGPWSDSENPLLNGLFGVLQSGAAARQTTADVWSALRVAAGTWQFQAQGGGELPDKATLEAAGQRILSEQGVGIQQVNEYRAAANQWRSAKEALHNAADTDQIRGFQVFSPPWAQTDLSEVPSRYRVRVQWEITPAGEEPIQAWATYELDSPLTSLQDVLDQAGALAARKPGSPFKSRPFTVTPLDYELEQI